MCLAGCVTNDAEVSTTFDPLTRFPARATYTWDDRTSSLPDDPRLEQLHFLRILKQVANEQLGIRGYRVVDAGAADYRLSYELHLNTWTGPDGSSAFGTLSLALRESGSRRRVWVGFVRAEVRVGLTEAERKERLGRSFARLLEKFPPSQRDD